MAGVILPYRGVTPTIHETAFVAPTAVVIGDTEIGEDTGIWFGCVVRGDVNIIRIGKRTNIQDGTIIHVASRGQGTFIGDDVTIGHMAVLHACTLEDGCFIGMKACVMDGATIESQAMVAAGALVTPGKRIKRGQLWAGSPARFSRELTEQEMAFFPESARHYGELARTYRSGP